MFNVLFVDNCCAFYEFFVDASFVVLSHSNAPSSRIDCTILPQFANANIIMIFHFDLNKYTQTSLIKSIELFCVKVTIYTEFRSRFILFCRNLNF